MTRQAPQIEAHGDAGHIVITGIGRTGTTFLVRLFTELGFDTGFSAADAHVDVDAIAQAGLEHWRLDDASPYVLKSPWFADELMTALTAGRIRIRTAIVPMRDLFAAAESRRRVFREALAAGHDPFAHPGSLVYTRRFDEQEMQLARRFHDTLLAVAAFDIPLVLLHFPRLVKDPEYLFAQLSTLLREHGVGQEAFMSAFAAVAQPELVHDFVPQAAGAIREERFVTARLLLARLRRKLHRQRRHGQG